MLNFNVIDSIFTSNIAAKYGDAIMIKSELSNNPLQGIFGINIENTTFKSNSTKSMWWWCCILFL